MKKIIFVLFTLFFLFYSFSSMATASEYMALNTKGGTDVFVREQPTQESKKLDVIWGSEWYGQSFVKPTGKTEGDWIQIESLYYGYPEAVKPKKKYGWVYGKYFIPASPKEDGFIFFQPTRHRIYGGLVIREEPNILSDSHFNLPSLSKFSMIGAKYLGQEQGWVKVSPTGPYAHSPGYILADFFGLLSQKDVVEFEEPKKYNLAVDCVCSRKSPDVRSSYAGYYYSFGMAIYIKAKKGSWMQTVDGDWIFHQYLEKFPLCLL